VATHEAPEPRRRLWQRQVPRQAPKGHSARPGALDVLASDPCFVVTVGDALGDGGGGGHARAQRVKLGRVYSEGVSSTSTIHPMTALSVLPQ
jgi:hypothetical protein